VTWGAFLWFTREYFFLPWGTFPRGSRGCFERVVVNFFLDVHRMVSTTLRRRFSCHRTVPSPPLLPCGFPQTRFQDNSFPCVGPHTPPQPVSSGVRHPFSILHAPLSLASLGRASIPAFHPPQACSGPFWLVRFTSAGWWFSTDAFRTYHPRSSVIAGRPKPLSHLSPTSHHPLPRPNDPPFLFPHQISPRPLARFCCRGTFSTHWQDSRFPLSLLLSAP